MIHDQGSVLYSRYSDGARPVRVTSDGYEVPVPRPDGSLVVTKFATAQALLAELTGHPTGRHWSLDRYFGLGPHAPKEDKRIGQADVLDLFQPLQTTHTGGITLLQPLAPPILAFKPSSPAITFPGKVSRKTENPVFRPEKRNSGVVISGPVGIDLVNRAGEVKKLLFSGFGRKIFGAGYDPEDVLQEVYRGILARNRGKCPWDPSKSSFGHYVYMVCSCVLSNYHRKQKRHREHEQIGVASYGSDGDYGYHDVSCSTTIPSRETWDQNQFQVSQAVDDLADFMLELPRGTSPEATMAMKVLPYITEGVTRANIAETLGVSQAAVSRAVSFLRKAASQWRDQRLA